MEWLLLIALVGFVGCQTSKPIDWKRVESLSVKLKESATEHCVEKFESVMAQLITEIPNRNTMYYVAVQVGQQTGLRAGAMKHVIEDTGRFMSANPLRTRLSSSINLMTTEKNSKGLTFVKLVDGPDSIGSLLLPTMYNSYLYPVDNFHMLFGLKETVNSLEDETKETKEACDNANGLWRDHYKDLDYVIKDNIVVLGKDYYCPSVLVKTTPVTVITAEVINYPTGEGVVAVLLEKSRKYIGLGEKASFLVNTPPSK
uniref:Capsid protein n=1 Tax=Jingmen tick virus TaxID=1172985 RepID=A0A7S9PRN3_9FLAV|nr:capsid protein [Jingmen tick virus]